MIGLFIGSFNPPTLAHLSICLKLKSDFEKIVFVPVNTKDKNLVALKKRFNMLMVYCHKYSFLSVDNIMEKYSYFDYRILDLLKDKYRYVKIIMGSDLLFNLDKFDNYEYILNNYSFVIITRNLYDAKKIIHDKYFNYQKHFKICNYISDCSSTKVRDLIYNKKDTKDYLDVDIASYIKKEHLYF